MDNETSGLEDDFLARHTTDPALFFQLLSDGESSPPRFTRRSTETPETAINTTALPSSTSASSTLTGNSRTNLTEVHSSLPAPDSRSPSQLQSAFGSVAQGNSTAEYLVEEPPVTLPPCVSDYIVESLEPRINNGLALEQGITRATAEMHTANEQREEREQRLSFDFESSNF